MKFTIGTVSSFQQYDTDLKLIKSSLLYADEIELIGLIEYAVFKYLPKLFDAEKNIDTLIDGLVQFLQSVNTPNSDDLIEKLASIQSTVQMIAPILRKKKRRSTAEIQAQIKANQFKKDLRDQVTELTQEFNNQPSSQEIKKLIDDGIVGVFDYDLRGLNMNEMTGSFIASILNTIYSTATFPLLDETSTKFVHDLADTKLIDISHLNAEVLRHAGVATSILMTLPTLEQATIDELLDLKRQNAAPLSRFRKAIYDFSEKISSLPWDNNFQYDCIKVYEADVLPQIAEINEVLTETSTLRNLGKAILKDEEIRKKASFAVGGLATAITTSSSITAGFKQLLLSMSIAAFSVEAASAFLKVIDLGVQAHDKAKEQLQKTKTNAMYYYFLASKL